MKRRGIVFLATMVLAMSSLGAMEVLGKTSAGEEVQAVSRNENKEVFDFTYHDSEKFYISDGWYNGGIFNCIWRKNNVSFNDGIMTLKIDKEPTGSVRPYSGAEYATNKTYGYGYYNVKMKPIKNDGVVSSFFTYCDNDGKGAHEIDIEFTGKDTTKVEFNYFTDGRTAGGFVYNLGFDASEELHEYGFLWLPDSITWYVDGKEAVHKEGNVPSLPGNIMMNVWNGTSPGWLKPYDGKTPLTAEYDWASYEAIDLADLNLDGEVTLEDLSIMATKYKLTNSSEGYKKQIDLNSDGIIDIQDIVILAKKI